MSDLLSTAQVAVKAGRSERTINRWRKVAPDFPKPVPLPCGGRVLFDPSEVDAFLEKHREAAA